MPERFRYFKAKCFSYMHRSDKEGEYNVTASRASTGGLFLTFHREESSVQEESILFELDREAFEILMQYGKED
jgi:site-specific DNA-adenine methylase